jgi:tetratricopeptide (TPR) repeat protein
LYLRGLVYAKKGEPEKAIRDYDQAIRVKPDFVGAFHDRALAYATKGQLDQTIGDLNQAIQLKSDYKIAHGNRGMAYHLLGRRDQALRDFKKQYSLGTRAKWLLTKLKEYGALPSSP